MRSKRKMAKPEFRGLNIYITWINASTVAIYIYMMQYHTANMRYDTIL